MLFSVGEGEVGDAQVLLVTLTMAIQLQWWNITFTQVVIKF